MGKKLKARKTVTYSVTKILIIKNYPLI